MALTLQRIGEIHLPSVSIMPNDSAVHSTPSNHDDNHWRRSAPAQLISHILTRYHQRHREQLPELIRLARRVEQVHDQQALCPNGLADHLGDLQQELESHMLKEEQILFPMLRRGDRTLARGPISVMRFEHEQHNQGLDKLHELTNNLMLPSGACRTWQALYAQLSEFCTDLEEHIRLENDILFSNPSEVPTAL